MALRDISLAQFNRIASGEYNAGLVDLKTDDNGNLTGELAKVVMGTLFNGAAQKMFDKNFSTTDKAKMLLDATGVATGELNVSKADLAKTLLPSFLYSGPSADEIVLNAIVEDTKNMGDKEKSYQIDIGI